MSTEYRVLGPLEVRENGVPIRLPGRKHRLLLARLLARANEVVSAYELIEELWEGTPPKSAENALQVYVSQLRKALGPARIVTTPSGYVLQAGEDEIDVGRFERLLAQGRTELRKGRAAAAEACLLSALAFWHGGPAAELDSIEAGRLEELRLAAVEELVEAELALGRPAEALERLDALIADNPLRERPRAQRMLALYRSGRQVEALDEYRNVRRLFVDELGIEPSPLLQRLERAILEQDPSLEPAPGQAPAATAGDSRELRKTVTVAFVTLSLAAAADELDPEALESAMSQGAAAVVEAFRQHGGAVERVGADRLLAVLGVPVAHEDDALRATRAADGLAGALARVSGGLAAAAGSGVSSKVGMESGEVLVSADGHVSGSAVIRASRLEQQASPGEVLLGTGTRALVRHAARLERADGTPEAWRLLGLHTGAPALERHFDTPMVGRQPELDRLLALFEHSAAQRVCHVALVLGEAGVGKSRLVHELCARTEGRATILSGRCLPYGEGITFWPLADMVGQAVGGGGVEALAGLVRDDESAVLIASRVAGAVGLAEPAGDRAEVFWAVRRLLEELAKTRPLVLVFDDLQWAEPTLAELLEHVAELAHDAPILLLCVARPELRDAHPSWAVGGEDATTIVLEPLPRDDCEALIGLHDAGLDLEPSVRRQIVDAAGGNPLYLEHLLAMLREGGGERRIPPTIHALLAARLDELAGAERAALERASVIGQEFLGDSLRALSPPEVSAQLDALLRSLIARNLVQPSSGRNADFRFAHLLVRDVAYSLLPKRVRSELHESYADLLESTTGDRIAEVEEIIGYHLEEAYRCRAAVGGSGAHEAELAARAASRLAAAGRRATARSDVTAARGLLARATELSDRESLATASLLTEFAEVLARGGDFVRARESLDEAIAIAERAHDEVCEWHARIVQLRVAVQRDPSVDAGEAFAATDTAIAVAAAAGDHRLPAAAWELRAWLLWSRGQALETEVALQESIEHARLAGEEHREQRAQHLSVGTWLYGPMWVEEAVERCIALVEEADQRWIRGTAQRCLAVLRAMQGRLSEAEELFEREQATLTALGLRLSAASASAAHGWAYAIAGDYERAERKLREAYDSMTAMGDVVSASTVAAQLARALVELGRADEALHFAEIGEQTAPAHDVQIPWRGPRARVLAARGDFAQATSLALEAVEIAERTDFLDMHGDALVDLSEVYRLAGDGTRAADAAARALDLYEQKGNLRSAARARALLADLAAAGDRSRRPAPAKPRE